MARPCTVCTHPERPGIDRALLESSATYRTIADRTGLSETALKRHRKEHLPATLVQARAVQTVAVADDLLAQVTALRDRARSILDKAEHSGDYRTALQGIREARACIELLLEVEGELDRRSVTNIIVSPDWVHLRTVLLEALMPYPEARLAVSGRLLALEGGPADAVDDTARP